MRLTLFSRVSSGGPGESTDETREHGVGGAGVDDATLGRLPVAKITAHRQMQRRRGLAAFSASNRVDARFISRSCPAGALRDIQAAARRGTQGLIPQVRIGNLRLPN